MEVSGAWAVDAGQQGTGNEGSNSKHVYSACPRLAAGLRSLVRLKLGQLCAQVSERGLQHSCKQDEQSLNVGLQRVAEGSGGCRRQRRLASRRSLLRTLLCTRPVLIGVSDALQCSCKGEGDRELIGSAVAGVPIAGKGCMVSLPVTLESCWVAWRRDWAACEGVGIR